MMTDGDKIELSDGWLPYHKRQEWDDITPVLLPDELPILAFEQDREIFAYMRAMLALKEKSFRALHLTTDALRMDTANSTIWQYRREILNALHSALDSELDFIDEIILRNQYSSEAWYHRQIIVEVVNDASRELAMTELQLVNDNYNYHAWRHRMWVIKTFDLYDGEQTFIDRFIAKDVNNNFAWNQRLFLVDHGGFTAEIVEREIKYALNHLDFENNNESVWGYLASIIKKSCRDTLENGETV